MTRQEQETNNNIIPVKKQLKTNISTHTEEVPILIGIRPEFDTLQPGNGPHYKPGEMLFELNQAAKKYNFIPKTKFYDQR